MDVLGLAMYEEVYSTTLQCEVCESLLPGTVGFKSRGELSEVQFLMNIGGKKVSNLGTLVIFMHLHKKCLSDFCGQHVLLPCPTALMLLLLARQFLFPLPS